MTEIQCAENITITNFRYKLTFTAIHYSVYSRKGFYVTGGLKSSKQLTTISVCFDVVSLKGTDVCLINYKADRFHLPTEYTAPFTSIYEQNILHASSLVSSTTVLNLFKTSGRV